MVNIVSHNLQVDNDILLKRYDIYNQISEVMADYQGVKCFQSYLKCTVKYMISGLREWDGWAHKYHRI